MEIVSVCCAEKNKITQSTHAICKCDIYGVWFANKIVESTGHPYASMMNFNYLLLMSNFSKQAILTIFCVMMRA